MNISTNANDRYSTRLDVHTRRHAAKRNIGPDSGYAYYRALWPHYEYEYLYVQTNNITFPRDAAIQRLQWNLQAGYYEVMAWWKRKRDTQRQVCTSPLVIEFTNVLLTLTRGASTDIKSIRRISF